MYPTTAPHPVLPTSKVETAEERLARDVEELTAVVRHADSVVALRREEAHVAVDERRVRSLRALPCPRRRADDVRFLLVDAYEELAAAYARHGMQDRHDWAARRAAEERGALSVAA